MKTCHVRKESTAVKLYNYDINLKIYMKTWLNNISFYEANIHLLIFVHIFIMVAGKVSSGKVHPRKIILLKTPPRKTPPPTENSVGGTFFAGGIFPWEGSFVTSWGGVFRAGVCLGEGDFSTFHLIYMKLYIHII